LRGEAPPQPTDAPFVVGGQCDVVTDRAVANALRCATGEPERTLLRAWQLMRELQDDRRRLHVASDERNRQLRVRYMANELSEAAWQRTLQRYEKDAHFQTANNHVKDVFIAASRDVLRRVVEPDVDLVQVKDQIEALLAYCNAASATVTKRFMRQAQTYGLRTH